MGNRLARPDVADVPKQVTVYILWIVELEAVVDTELVTLQSDGVTVLRGGVTVLQD